jgi:hypothetical protein
MEEITFKPDYGASNIIASILMFLLGGALLAFGYQEGSSALLVGGVFCFFVVVFSFIAYPRRIVLFQNRVSVIRYILPNQVFEYQEFTDIGGTAIKFGRRGISLLNMRNNEELVSVFQKMIDERKIQPTQVQGKLAVEEALTSKAMKYAIIPGILLSFIVNMLLETYLDIHIDARLVSGTVIIITLLAVYYFLKNRQKME